jgi:hypothetical protein
MKPRALLWCTACAMAFWGKAAAAVPTYSFVFDQTNYSVVPGGKVDVTVYLQETVSSGPSVLDGGGVGMFCAGVLLTDVAPLPIDPAAVLLASDIAKSSSFDDSPTREVTATTAGLKEAMVSPFDSTHADDATPGRGHYSMTIGTFSFTAGSTPGEIMHVEASRFPAGLGDYNITGVGVPLDTLIGPASCTITVLPEPSSLVLTGIAALAVFACLSRSSKKP